MACSTNSQAQRDCTSTEKKEVEAYTIEHFAKAEEQSLKSYISRKAECDLLMTECKCLIAKRKPPAEEIPRYERPLHGAWHGGVSKVADMAEIPTVHSE